MKSHQLRQPAAQWEEAARKAARTDRWAETMAKVAIRRAAKDVSGARWQFANFRGPGGGESVGVVDVIAVRKDHRSPSEGDRGLKRGDALQLILIQIKGGSAAMPTPDDGDRLRILKRRHRASHVLLACWKKGTKAHFYELKKIPANRASGFERDWRDVGEASVFGRAKRRLKKTGPKSTARHPRELVSAPIQRKG
jgi:hypothetical protein